MAPRKPEKNRERFVVQFPDGEEIVVPSARTAFYRAQYGPIGTIACRVTNGQRTLLATRRPDPDRDP